MRSSKDIARRLRLRGYPGRDTFRRRYGVVAALAVVAALGAWTLMHNTLGPREYLPRPVSSNHALFGDRCESCHDAFRPVADAACLGCHSLRLHATNEKATPACAHCHAEHRPTDVFLSVSAKACVTCHASLETEGADAVVERAVGSFAAHPEFTPLRDGKRDRDPSRVRFNHQVHLTSPEIPENERPLACAKCHHLEPTGRWMEPIRFASHCQRCHQQIVEGPTGSIEALHAEPQVIREDLRKQLLDAAASIGTVTSEELRKQLDKLATPSPELLFPTSLPGRIARSGFSKERLSVAALERDLYKPFEVPQPVDGAAPARAYDSNKACFLCHFEQGAREETDGLPVIAPTAIPARWLERSEFSHVRHELMPCEECHARVATSRATEDTNLPDKAACQRCHADGERVSAGTVCMSCHLYHDTSRATPAGAPVPAGAHASEADCDEGSPCGAKPLRLSPLRPQIWWKDAGLSRK